MKNIKSICPKCGRKRVVRKHPGSNGVMCTQCLRQYYPPNMTLLRFEQGSVKRLWNVDIGLYEDLNDVEDLSWCGWFLRSKQETIYRKSPIVKATVYFMEYYGDFACGRCLDYPYFPTKDPDPCKAIICSNVCKPKLSKDKIQTAPAQSRYRKWLKIG